jgi:hypothetical protein
VNGFTFYGIPAKHNEIERDQNGNCKFMGYVIEFGGNKIYHSGDTLWFDGMTELLQPFQVDVAILPINGNKPERKVAGNLDCKEAAKNAGGYIISDGGIKVPGDISKAFAAGADFVMLGSILSGHIECDGEIIQKDN